MNAADLPDKVRNATCDILGKLAGQRIWLHRCMIAGGGLVIGIGEAGVNFADDRYKPALGSFWIFGLVLVALGLLLEPDGSEAATVKLLHEMESENGELKRKLEDESLFSAELADGVDFASTLYETHRSLVQAAATAAHDGAQEIPRICERLLDIVVERRTVLCSMGDEKWNFAIYLWDEQKQELNCAACRRWSRESENQSHRVWKSNSGHVGHAFARKRELVCEDATHASIAAIIQGTGEHARDYDSGVYRSIASIPITTLSGELPLGVVVATSDQPSRFVGESDEIQDNVEALRALANVLATLLASYRVRQSAQDESGRN